MDGMIYLFAASLLCIVPCVTVLANPLTATQWAGAEDAAALGNNLIGPDIPRIKMLKRQIAGFSIGKTASVTYVFQSTLNVSIRWFTRDLSSNFKDSEIPNMKPINGDPSYQLSTMSAGEVTATSVSIPGFDGKIPVEFEAIISDQNGTQQYQLKTKIITEVKNEILEDIDSPEWMIVPNNRMFQPRGNLNVHCKVFVPYEKEFTNEMYLKRAMPRNLQNNQAPEMEMIILKSAHKEEPNAAEENGKGKVMYQGRRLVQKYPQKKGKPKRPDHTIYEIRLMLDNASQDHEGIYQCELVREFDKVYYIASVTMEPNMSLFPDSPKADLIACNPKKFKRYRKTASLTLHQGQETCIRCRGFGFPTPKVALYKGAHEIGDSERINVLKYINVADAGVAEATYIFRSPSGDMQGGYNCIATNDHGNHRISFTVKFR